MQATYWSGSRCRGKEGNITHLVTALAEFKISGSIFVSDIPGIHETFIVPPIPHFQFYILARYTGNGGHYVEWPGSECVSILSVILHSHYLDHCRCAESLNKCRRGNK